MFGKSGMGRQTSFNWLSVLKTSSLDIAMVVCAILAVFAFKDGSPLFSVETIMVTSVFLALTAIVTAYVKIKSHRTSTAKAVGTAFLMVVVVAAVWYLGDLAAAATTTDGLLMAVYLNVAVGVLVWDNVRDYVPAQARPRKFKQPKASKPPRAEKSRAKESEENVPLITTAAPAGGKSFGDSPQDAPAFLMDPATVFSSDNGR